MAGHHITDDARNPHHHHEQPPSHNAHPESNAAAPAPSSASPSMARGRMSPARTIAFLNQKGGVGKTTTVVNLAAAMAAAGRRVAVIDLDPQAHLTLHLGVEPDEGAPTVYDVLIDPNQSADHAFVESRPGLFVLPAEVDLAAAEIELSQDHERNRRLALKIRDSEIAKGLDAILIDCPPSLGLLTLNALALAREVFVPMQAHFLALQGLSRLLETVGMVATQVNRSLEVTGIILCMFEGNTRLASEIVGDLTEFFETQRGSRNPWRHCRVLDPPIRRNIKLAESPSFGQSIFDYDPSCPGAHDYQQLAANVLREWDSMLAHRSSDGAALASSSSDSRHTNPTPSPRALTDDEAADIVVRHMQEEAKQEPADLDDPPRDDISIHGDADHSIEPAGNMAR